MTQAMPSAEAKVHQALLGNDPGLAQSMLDQSGDEINARQGALLQARIHLRAGTPEAAIEVLRGMETPRPAELRVIAWAYYQSGDARAALDAIDAAIKADDKPAKETDALLRLRAATDLGDRARATKIAEQALAAHPGNPALRRQSTLSFLAVGAIDETADLIATLTVDDKVPHSAFIDFIERGLRHGHAAAIIKGMPAIERLSNNRFDMYLRRAWATFSDEEKQGSLSTTLADVAICAGSPTLLSAASNLLINDGKSETALDLVRQYRARHGASPDRGLDQHKKTRPYADVDHAVPHGDLLRKWLGLPVEAPGAWARSVWQGATDRKEIKARLQADPAAWTNFMESLEMADLGHLRALAETRAPAILATTHAGVLMGTLAQLEKNSIPVEIVGGNFVMSRLLDGGNRLNSIPKDQSPTATARALMRHIQERRIVGLACDGTLGSQLHRTVHERVNFALPDSIPQLAHRFGLPIVWVASYWKGARIVCDCEPGPGVAANESFEAFRQRWFDFALDRIRSICIASGQNVMPIARLIQEEAVT